MMAFAQCFLLLLGCHFSCVVQCMELAHEFFVPRTLLCLAPFFRLNQVLCQPLAVAQTQPAQHVENILK